MLHVNLIPQETINHAFAFVDQSFFELLLLLFIQVLVPQSFTNFSEIFLKVLIHFKTCAAIVVIDYSCGRICKICVGLLHLDEDLFVLKSGILVWVCVP